jgi:hypothetical protein
VFVLIKTGEKVLKFIVSPRLLFPMFKEQEKSLNKDKNSQT